MVNVGLLIEVYVEGGAVNVSWGVTPEVEAMGATVGAMRITGAALRVSTSSALTTTTAESVQMWWELSYEGVESQVADSALVVDKCGATS